MFEVFHARHRHDYFMLAFKYWVSPQHIWNLAHGGQVKTEKDKRILHNLVDLGILKRHKKMHEE